MIAVNAEIRSRMSSDAAPLIPELAAHLIEAGGKRLRPVLTLAAAKLCGYEGSHHIRLAATVEFIHTATLLHDDVVDESDRRRGRETANILWGNKAPVLVGDFLFSRSFQLMVETENLRVLEILSNASAVIAEGEVLQLSLANRVTADDTQYMRVIRGKTAALFEAATQVGGVIAGASAEEEEALATYGDALGIAFQLVDDALDYGGKAAALGKRVGDDFREGKATLPVILSYAQGDETERAFWTRCMEPRHQVDGDLEQALTYLTASGSIDATVARASDHIDRATKALGRFKPSPMGDALIDVADFVVSRVS
ncbi:MAG: polyprenyl synthetase family protein [Pseudomonadota bacterium]